MRAITFDTPGGPLTETEMRDPRPDVGEVVIDVVAAGVNPADVMQHQGHYPPPSGASEILGLECSGRISELGEGVEGWQVGDEVCALLAGGGYATKAAVPAGQLLPIPRGVSLESAAALPEAAATVWSNLFDTARLRPGETLLVHGGSGGIGTIALQIARFLGVRVFCTASAEKADQCRALGAERVIDYRTEDFVEVIRKETGGADVILDTVGAKYLSKNLAALANHGRLVVIGLQGGRTGEIDLGMLLTKRATLTGTTLRSRPLPEKTEIITDLRGHVWPLIEAGQVQPVIDTAFALADAALAHEYLEQGKHVGKILLVT